MRSRRVLVSILFATISLAPAGAGVPGEEPSREEAREALVRAIRFFREQVGVEGGYLWRYSADLEKREGEGKVGPRTAWTQPPGTPFVGEGYLEVHELTGLEEALEAARQTARLLLRGQLHSGGWPDRVELDADARRRFAYLVDGKRRKKARDVSILDDDRTQSVLRFLMRYDRATRFRQKEIGIAVRRGLRSLLAAQHANGAWGQVYRGPAVDTARPADLRASFAPRGKETRIKEYWDHYTLNDNVISDAIDTLILAAEIYGEDEYLESAQRAGGFLLLAQLPEPQPGWAQQYDPDMRPAWARKFEPPAISGSEGPRAIGVLLDLYESTGERRFLEPIPRALAYYERSRLPDGKLARFYEPRTNRPLYFTREYELTYSDADVPTHYSFKSSVDLEGLRRRYERLAKSRTPRAARESTSGRRPSKRVARALIDALDERGAWVEEGRMRYWGKGDTTRRIIDPRTFVRNARTLARYVGRE